MVLGYTWVIEDGFAANLSLEIGILVQTGVLILSTSINPTQSCTGLSLRMCLCLCKMHVKAVHGYV